MKNSLLIIAICLSWASHAGTQLDAFKASLVDNGTVEFVVNAPAYVENLGNGIDGRTLHRVGLRVTYTTDAAGSQRDTTKAVLVYQLDKADEIVADADPGIGNYIAADIAPTPFEAAKIATDAALGAGNWKFIRLESSDSGSIAHIRVLSTNAKLAITLAADGTPITVESE